MDGEPSVQMQMRRNHLCFTTPMALGEIKRRLNVSQARYWSLNAKEARCYGNTEALLPQLLFWPSIKSISNVFNL